MKHCFIVYCAINTLELYGLEDGSVEATFEVSILFFFVLFLSTVYAIAPEISSQSSLKILFDDKHCLFLLFYCR